MITLKQAKFIVRLTCSPYLPTIIGRSRYWHRLFYKAGYIIEKDALALQTRVLDSSNQNLTNSDLVVE
jgi:hypothetical protein